MRIKAFTLAETLIAIMIIGVLAASMIPNILSGVRNARYKAAYKRSYQEIHSIIAKEYLGGQIPSATSDNGLSIIYAALLGSLSTKEYAEQKQPDANDGILLSLNNFKPSVQYSSGSSMTTYGSGASANGTGSWLNSASPWIITENNFAYALTGIANPNCSTKEVLNSIEDINELNSSACGIVIVDTNGLVIGPNKIEEQVITGVSKTGKVNMLQGDRYYIYIGSNGVATGSKATSLSARLINGIN